MAEQGYHLATELGEEYRKDLREVRLEVAESGIEID